MSPRPDELSKVLLLGSGESGKSTLCFQIRVINEGKNEKKRHAIYDSYKGHVYFNLYEQTLRIATAIMAKVELPPKTKKAIKSLEDFIKDEHPRSLMEKIESEKVKDAVHVTFYIINEIWKDYFIRDAFQNKDGFYYFPGIEYFFQEETILRIGRSGYVPHHHDVLLTRKKTTGITEYKILEDTTPFRIVDVGGQKNERKKWKNCLQNVEILIYVISLANYDEKLYEDQTINSMRESLEIWNGTITGEWFKETQIIIVFNKFDLLKKKIIGKDRLSDEFNEYTGQTDPEMAKKFIMNMYLKDFQNDPRFTIIIGSALEEDTAREVMDAMIKLKKK